MENIAVLAGAGIIFTTIWAGEQIHRRTARVPSPEKDVESLPDFEAMDITDIKLIREELRRGPSIDFHVGPDETHFTLPLRLVAYYSAPVARFLDPSYQPEPVSLPTHDPQAFSKVQTWLNEGKFDPGVLSQSTATSPDIRTGIRNACSLLCRIYLLAETLQIEGILSQTWEELRKVTQLAREMSHPFPIVPEVVIEIHERSEKPSALVDLVVEAMKAAALEGAVDTLIFAECFEKLPALRDTILVHGVGEGIFSAWKRMAENEEWDGNGCPEVDAGREAGWWKGPL